MASFVASTVFRFGHAMLMIFSTTRRSAVSRSPSTGPISHGSLRAPNTWRSEGTIFCFIGACTHVGRSPNGTFLEGFLDFAEAGLGVVS